MKTFLRTKDEHRFDGRMCCRHRRRASHRRTWDVMGDCLWITKGSRSGFEIAKWLGLALLAMLMLVGVIVGMASVFQANSPHPGESSATTQLDPPDQANTQQPPD